MSAYFIILIFFPMFNIFILSIDRGTHFLVNTGLILTFSVIPTILFWSKGIFGNGYQYTWFIVLYFIGAITFNNDLKNIIKIMKERNDE